MYEQQWRTGRVAPQAHLRERRPARPQPDHTAATPHILDPGRLAIVRSVRGIAPELRGVFDGLTAAASRTLSSQPVAITLVDDARQCVVSLTGAAPPPGIPAEVPLAYSFCRHVVDSGSALQIGDARRHRLTASNPSVARFGIVAYAGSPLRTRSGHCIGAFAAFALAPRIWTADSIALLDEFASAVALEIDHALELLGELDAVRRQAAELRRLLRQRQERVFVSAGGILEALDSAAQHVGDVMTTEGAAPEAAAPVIQAESPLLALWHQLKERRVVRVATIYLAASWLAIDVTSQVLPPLKVPDAVMTYIVLAAGAGFIMSVIIAWFFDLTPRGLMRARHCAAPGGTAAVAESRPS